MLLAPKMKKKYTDNSLVSKILAHYRAPSHLDSKMLTMQNKSDGWLMCTDYLNAPSTLGSPRAESKPADTRTRSGSNWK